MTSLEMPTMPPLPRPALVLNMSLPMARGGKIIPQPLWMESQLKDYAQQHAQQFERAAASLALERADLAAEVEKLRRTLGDIAEYAHKTDEVRRWCAEALGVNPQMAGASPVDPQPHIPATGSTGTETGTEPV